MKKKENATLKDIKTSTSGITLIALIITIIALIILAAVSLAALTGDNGIIERARSARVDNIISNQREIVEMAITTVLVDNMGIKDNVSVEAVLGEIQKQNNSTDIYAVKNDGVITATEGTTKFGASFLFPKETINLNKGLRIDVDDKLNITNVELTEVDSVEGALANIEVNKANVELNLKWENGTPKVEYEETKGANVTIQYQIGTEGTLKTATGGVISEPTLKLGDTVFVIVSKDGKQKDGGSVLVIDETEPKITKFEATVIAEDSITVEVTAQDNESGLATTGTYTYYKDEIIDGTSTTDNTHVYTSLTAGTYKLKVEVVDKAGKTASAEIDGTIEQTTGAGIYDSNGTMLASWNTLVNDYNLNVEKDYGWNDYDTNNADGNSMYYVLTKSPFSEKISGKTGLTVVMPGSNQETAVVNDKLDIVNSYEIASINEGVRVATTNNQISKIGSFAFYYCRSLTSVTIPDSVTSIGDYAFYDCYSLTSVTIPDSVTSIGDNAFDYCKSLTSVTIPDSVTSIGDFLFYNCSSLTSVTIGNSVTSIGHSTFSNCSSLTSVTIGNSVTNIYSDLFSSCSSLTNIEVTPGNIKYSSKEGALYDKNKTTLIKCPNGKEEFTIPDSVTSIGDDAFDYCSSLTSVTIGNSVTTNIDIWTFSSCSSLTNIEVTPSNIKYSSKEGVLYDKNKTTLIKCPNGKEEFTIPDSVTSIGYSAFQDCSSLTSVTIGNSVTSIGYSAFQNCSSLTSVTIPDSVTSIEYCTFCGCSSLTSVTIPDSVISIGDNAFQDCSSLTSVTIPDSVTSIGEGAFSYCSSLTSVTLGSITKIPRDGFANCSSLTSVTIPDSVTNIGENAFYNCSSLNISIPATVKYINGERAFYGCAGVEYANGWEHYFGSSYGY